MHESDRVEHMATRGKGGAATASPELRSDRKSAWARRRRMPVLRLVLLALGACLYFPGPLAHAQGQADAGASIDGSSCDFAQNGSFESPDIQGDPNNPAPGTAYVNGWAVWRTSQATINGWQVVAGTIDILKYFNNASAGSQSIDLWGTAPATFEQTFNNLVPGQTYSFSIDYSGLSAANSRAGVYLDLGSGPQLLQTLSPSVNGVGNGNGGLPTTPQFTVVWQTYNHSFVATGTQAKIRFVNQAAPATLNTGLFIDNFTFRSASPCQDFGDAPNSYGTLLAGNGARHSIPGYNAVAKTAPLMLGSSIGAETEGQPASNASADTFDDGLVPGSVSLLPGATTAQASVRAVNATPNPATLAGWIDFNNNGMFEPGERAQVTVPANTNTATAFTLNWSGFAALPVSFSSFARFRIATSAADVAVSTGIAADGEVEDYRVPTVPAFATCDTRAFLFQSSPTDVFSVDLVTGGSLQVGTDISPVNINAVGYNPLDNYVYGMDSAASGTGLIRVGSDFSVQTLGFPAGLPNSLGFNIGEFDNNGHYWINQGATGNVYEVDLKPGSATYFQVVGTHPINAIAGFTGGADWAYNPVDGFLYRTPTNTTTGNLHLFRYNRTTGLQANLGPIAGIAADLTILTGANYSDAAGFIYASDNTSGRIFRVNTTTISGSLLSTGPLSGTNDGARCFNAPVPIDFGDAPNTYGTLLANNGARHSIPGYNAAAKTAPLMLGSRISAEADGQPSSDASADTFDDGLVPGSVQLLAGATTASVQVKAINAKATPATLAGWIDFNNNGTFDAGERAQVAVPANTMTATTFTLNWTGLAPIASGFSAPARFRIATTAAQVANPIGAAADGEVEDYVVPTTLPVFDCASNPSLFNTAYNVANGGVLPPGSRDRNWDVGLGTPTGGPSSVTNWIDAYVTGNAVPGSWATSPFGNADWISFFSNANQGAANVDEYHRYRFTLDSAVVPSTFSLSIDFYANNSI